MENEQEEIVLETDDLQEGIVLPSVDEQEDHTQYEDNTQNIQEAHNNNGNDDNQGDDEKERLRRGVNDERKRRKEAEKKNKELEARIKALEEVTRVPQKTTVEELVESGVDEGIAKSIAAAIDKKQEGNSKLAEELANVKFENSLTKISKEEGYEDILDYADEIKELVDKGLTIEQSYHAITYDMPKTKNTKSEIERKVEARLQNNQARKEILGNYNRQTGATPTTSKKINATSEEKGIAALAGMTVEEYVALRDMDSVKEYQMYKSKKK